jgi:hypothetical protein
LHTRTGVRELVVNFAGFLKQIQTAANFEEKLVNIAIIQAGIQAG